MEEAEAAEVSVTGTVEAVPEARTLMFIRYLCRPSLIQPCLTPEEKEPRREIRREAAQRHISAEM